jgi:curved DNA-binding protein CbpA
MINYFEILQISETSTLEQITLAYQRLAKSDCPQEYLNVLDEAYSVLKDETKRSNYIKVISLLNPSDMKHMNEELLTQVKELRVIEKRYNKLKFKTDQDRKSRNKSSTNRTQLIILGLILFVLLAILGQVLGSPPTIGPSRFRFFSIQ